MKDGSCNVFALPAYPDLVPATTGTWEYYDAACFLTNTMRCGKSGNPTQSLIGFPETNPLNIRQQQGCHDYCENTPGCVSYAIGNGVSQIGCIRYGYPVLGNVIDSDRASFIYYDMDCPISS